MSLNLEKVQYIILLTFHEYLQRDVFHFCNAIQMEKWKTTTGASKIYRMCPLPMLCEVSAEEKKKHLCQN